MEYASHENQFSTSFYEKQMLQIKFLTKVFWAQKVLWLSRPKLAYMEYYICHETELI